MNSIDEKIVRILQENARTPLKQIANEVFLSSPAVSARIARLENEGLIRHYTTIVDPYQLGYHIKAYVSLEITPSQKEEVYPYLKNHPNVLECDCVTGNYSLFIKVMFRSTMDLDKFIGEIQKYGKTSTQIVFSTVIEKPSISV